MLLPVMQTLEILIATYNETIKFSQNKHDDHDRSSTRSSSGVRNSKRNYAKVPKIFDIMLQMLIIDQITLLTDNNAVSALKLPRGDPLRFASSNHTSYIIDQDSVNSTSTPSLPSKGNKPGSTPTGLKEITLDAGDADDDDEYEEDGVGPGEDEDDEEEEEEDDDDFYTTNPVDSLPTGTTEKKFDDFDDFDALGLNNFYGDAKKRNNINSNKEEERTKAMSKPFKEAALWSQTSSTTANKIGEQTAKQREPRRGRKRLPGRRRRKFRRRRRKMTKKKKVAEKGGERAPARVEEQKSVANKTSTASSRQLHDKAPNVSEISSPPDTPKSRAASIEREQQASPSDGPEDTANRCAMISKSSGTCVDYNSVEWALYQARQLIEFRRPDGLGSLEPSEDTVHAIGELTEWTSRMIAMRFGLTSEEVADSMDQIDMSQTSLWRLCPRVFRSPWARQCNNYQAAVQADTQTLQYQLDPNLLALTSGRYRSLTGQCNNPLVPNLGSSFMSFVRMNTPEYGDGIGSGRRPQSGLAELPPPRLVSLALHSGQLVDMPSNDLSAMFASWGQLINHDLALASGARVATGHGESCCTAGTRISQVSDPLGRVCMPIYVGPSDPVYGPFGVRCLDFKRSIAGLRPGCSLGPRTQLNLVSAFVDGSFVYGSTRTLGNSLRLNSNGRGQMAVWDYFGETTGANGETIQRKPLLPPQLDEPDDECLGRRDGLYCFRSGDFRTNQQVPLVVLHTVHTRQHNRLAEALSEVNPHWSSERIFQEARHIHIAQIQHILMREYLPLILGSKTRVKFGLIEAPQGEYWDHYEATLNPGISQEFAAAAFRQGHSSVASEIYRVDVLTRMPRQRYRLRELFRQPWPLFEPGAVDEFLLGMTEAASREMDPFVSRELGGHLLQEPNEPVGLDLIAINIQRGRDQGVANYNSMRDWCGLGRLETIDDLVHAVGNHSAQLMSELYESIDDIDLYSGGLSELPVESGGLLGPTFSCIVAQQFSLLRQGDRYWYESSGEPQAFTRDQLASIKGTTLARIICANSDQIWTIQPLAMRLPHPIYNPPVRCQDLPDLDLSLWVEFSDQPQQAAVDDGGDG